MNKKYRLKIPEMINKVHSWIIEALNEAGIYEYIEDGENFSTIFDENISSEYKTDSWCFSDIPKDWLEEITEKPKSAEEYSNYILQLEKATQSYKEIVDGVQHPGSMLDCMIKRVAKDSHKAGQESKNYESISIGDAFKEVREEMEGMDDLDKLSFAVDRMWSWCKLSYDVGDHYDKHLIPIAEKLKSHNLEE